MQITKFGHACVVIENQGSNIVIDPGSLSKDFVAPTNIVAIVITHIHSDHCDPMQLQAILQSNPNAQLFSTQEVATSFPELPFTAVTAGQVIPVGTMQLEFFGSQHATIYTDRAPNQNIGVMVNDTFFYPGDAFTEPNRPIHLLALPLSAPWLKASEVLDYVSAVRPVSCFPTHDALLSEAGYSIYTGVISETCQKIGVQFQPLPVGQPVTFS